MRLGKALPEDPQFAIALAYPAVARVDAVQPGDTLQVGPIVLTAHFTGGHTPGGTTWSWRACEDGRCHDLVYADSQTPISADGFSFTGSSAYPSAIRDFEAGHALLERLACDILITPHPGFAELFQRHQAREAGARDAFLRLGGCREYAAWARRQLAARLERERAAR
jgi:metallo-beta-lactamase class B